MGAVYEDHLIDGEIGWRVETRCRILGRLVKLSGGVLQRTGKKILVEASPTDRIWGIGLSANDEAATDPSRWRGLNLLGFALMDVRDALAS
jgi:hypothetical protein